jgi:CDGSH-type Zn-finger protein
MTEKNPNFKIEILPDGPYRIHGGVPLRKMRQVCTDKGEPIDWQDVGEYDTKRDPYILCRCGKTKNPPFCDGAHVETGFVGEETAITAGPFGRMLSYYGPDGLTVSKITRLCTNSGFCVLVDTDFIELTEESGDPVKKARVIKMVEDCPSGSLVYKTERDGDQVEPDLPVQIADTFECTSYGEIQGPLWVTGYIPIERADKAPFTPRNRVTLCTCGHSRIKPLCDGTHRPLYEHRLRSEARKRQLEELSNNDQKINLQDNE